MMATSPRRRAYQGPVLLSYGFRSLFLAGAIWSALAIALWLPLWLGTIELPTAFTAIDWHAHEMLYGYLAAIMTGFLLTAIPNWTGRMPLQGGALALLLLAWAAGRIAVALSARIGPVPAAVIDLAFLSLVAAAAAREVAAGRNWRNLPPVGVVLLLLGGNVLFHRAAIDGEPADLARRVAIAAAVLLIVLFGGRVIPSFTRNWLLRAGPGRLPAVPGRFDQIGMALAMVGLAAWVAMPDSPIAGGLLIVAGAVQAARQVRWAGDRTGGEALVLILHLGYAFVPLGFVLAGLAILLPDVVPPSAAVHAWTAGAIGVMTIAMMTRVALGHTGRALTASAATRLVYAAVLLAVVMRLLAAFDTSHVRMLLMASATAWIAAFAVYCVAYGPILAKPRADAKARGAGGIQA